MNTSEERRTHADMFQEQVEIEDILIHVDPINRKRTEGSDNAMAIFYEEQPLMWTYVKHELATTITSIPGEIDFLDVGTGSGIWAILVAKHLNPRRVLAIDKNPRALVIAQHNAEENGVQVEFRNEFYNISTALYKSCKTIGIYAPYHLYPAEVELLIPQHARGGIDGQQVFKEQLMTANYHLAENGIIVFNQMCLGRNGQPDFTRYIPQIMTDCSLDYINILPPMPTRQFLEGVYENNQTNTVRQYINRTAANAPELYYCDGIIRRDHKNRVKDVLHNLDLKGRTWEDRMKLHYEIAQHTMQDTMSNKGKKSEQP